MHLHELTKENSREMSVDVSCKKCGEQIVTKGTRFPIGSTKVYCSDNHKTIILIEISTTDEDEKS